MTRRRPALAPAGRVLALLSCAAMVVATQLSWVASGSASRNSYEMFRSAQRLGLDQLTPLRVVWFLLPVFCLGAVLMIALSHLRTAAAFVVLSSIIGLVVAGIVLASGRASGAGAALALAGSLGGVASAALLGFGSGRQRSGELENE